jgi:hypothetical protein
MTDVTLSEKTIKGNESEISEEEGVKIPEFRRDIFPTNIILSAQDILELFRIISHANEASIRLEIQSIKDVDDARENKINNIKSLMKIEYSIMASGGDNIRGIDVPEYSDFPDDLNTVYISNSDFAKQRVNSYPLNRVESFLCFTPPNLKMDFSNLPSNATENRSVINITGRDENWVRATADKLKEFFEKKKSLRPVIHGSSVYDLFLYLFFLPIVLNFLGGFDSHTISVLNEKSIFFNVIAGVYFLLLTLIVARLIFQLIRCVFPPIEYYKSKRTRALIIRTVTSTVMLGLFVNAIYDIAKTYIF